MENLSCKFAILRFCPSSVRGETVNVGVALFIGDDVSIHITPRLEKAHAIAPGVDISEIQELQDSSSDLFNGLETAQEKLELLQRLGPLTATDFGYVSPLQSELASLPQNLIATYVDAPRYRSRVPVVRHDLRDSLADTFASRAQLSKEPQDISRHLVVSRFPIAASERLYSDFAYKNGVYRFAQAVDLRTSESAMPRRFEESCRKALALDKAVRTFGTASRRFVVFAKSGVSNEYQDAALALLTDYADDVFDVSEPSEVNRFHKEFAPELATL